MKTQFDHTVRVVSLENLKAMYERESAVCHRYHVGKVTANRVYVQYSNPDQYGNEDPMTIVFPCYPSTFDKAQNPAVVLDALRVINDTHSGEGWQAFLSLLESPKLWRHPGGHIWHTTTEIEEANTNTV